MYVCFFLIFLVGFVGPGEAISSFTISILISLCIIYSFWFARSLSRCSSGLAEDFAAVDGVDGRSPRSTPPRTISVPARPLSASNSRRGSLLPSQQSCEVDDESIMNENSLMTELIQVQQLTVSSNMIIYIKTLCFSFETKRSMGKIRICIYGCVIHLCFAVYAWFRVYDI